MKMLSTLSRCLVATLLLAQPLCADMLGVTNGAGDGPGELVRVDIATGNATLIGTLPQPMTEAVFNAEDGRFYAQGSNGSFVLYEIDPTDASVIDSTDTDGAYTGMAFVNGVLYASSIGCPGCASNLVTVNPLTGEQTVIGPTGFGPLTGLALHEASGTMYGVVGGNSPDSASLVTVNLQTGAASLVGPTTYDKVGSIEFGSDGRLYGSLTSNDGDEPEALIWINVITGQGAYVGDTGYSITGLAETAPASTTGVPALNTLGLVLMLLLVGGVGWAGLRRT